MGFDRLDVEFWSQVKVADSKNCRFVSERGDDVNAGVVCLPPLVIIERLFGGLEGGIHLKAGYDWIDTVPRVGILDWCGVSCKTCKPERLAGLQ